MNKKSKELSSQASAVMPTTITTSLDSSSQFLISGAPSSDSQESASNSAIESSSMDGTKAENGVLCGNARLQEAWELETKGSPDTPWRYTPSTNSLSMESLKVYSRDGESSSGPAHNIVHHAINKGQGIEMSSGGIIFQTKKFLTSVNNAKSLIKTGQASNARAAAEQENQQRKQQALEHQLRLQKSLSEECEDLGVDEPSTSDLFPEADLLFDTNHSPAFDHSSQEAGCSQVLRCVFFHRLASYSCNDTLNFNVISEKFLLSAGARIRAVTNLMQLLEVHHFSNPSIRFLLAVEMLVLWSRQKSLGPCLRRGQRCNRGEQRSLRRHPLRRPRDLMTAYSTKTVLLALRRPSTRG